MEPVTRPITPSRPPWAFGALAAAAAAAVVVIAVIVSSGGAAPAATQEPQPGIGSCVETYSTTSLAARDFAFDGTVSSIDGEQVTFDVGSVYTGDVPASVTLTATGMTGSAITSGAGPSLVDGERYLVAGDDEFAWGCGFTQAYDEAVAAEWAEATR